MTAGKMKKSVESVIVKSSIVKSVMSKLATGAHGSTRVHVNVDCLVSPFSA